MADECGKDRKRWVGGRVFREWLTNGEEKNQVFITLIFH